MYLLSRLEYVKVPCGTKLEVAGVTGKGAIVDRGFSKSVVGQDDQYYILGLQRSTDGKSVRAVVDGTLCSQNAHTHPGASTWWHFCFLFCFFVSFCACLLFAD